MTIIRCQRPLPSWYERLGAEAERLGYRCPWPVPRPGPYHVAVESDDERQARMRLALGEACLRGEAVPPRARRSQQTTLTVRLPARLASLPDLSQRLAVGIASDDLRYHRRLRGSEPTVLRTLYLGANARARLGALPGARAPWVIAAIEATVDFR